LAVEAVEPSRRSQLGADVEQQLGQLHALIDRLGEDPGLWFANWHQAAAIARSLTRVLSEWLLQPEQGPSPSLSAKLSSSLGNDRWNHGLRFPLPGRSAQVSAGGRLVFADGAQLPLLGVLVRPESSVQSIRWALEAGLRFVYLELDGAEVTATLGHLRRALAESKVHREELVVAARVACSARLDGLGIPSKGLGKDVQKAVTVGELDALVLGPAPEGPAGRVDLECWKELESLHAARSDGLGLSLGVNNLSPQGVSELLDSVRLPPAFVKNSFTIYEPGGPDEARRQDSQMERLSALRIPTLGFGISGARGVACGYLRPLEDPHIAAVAEKYGRSAAQVINRWFLQLGGGLLLEATGKRKELLEAADVFTFSLAEADMRLLNGLSSLAASSPGRRAPAWCEDVYGLSSLPFDDTT
ncbi:unnamed protein product, partial [Polarella glacialis]